MKWWAVTRITVILCIALHGAGCFLIGDRVGTSQTVTLKFPSQSKLPLSVKDREVEEVCQLIDSVLASKGFARAPDLTPPSEESLASHTKGRESAGLRLKGDTLEVGIIEWGNKSGHARAATKELGALIRGEFNRSNVGQKARVEQLKRK